jgi:polyketide cyclase/dehydrase/lipid transport protein
MSNWIHVETSYVIDARPEEIYAVVSDYHVGHPAILPRQYFTELIVEQGGQGAGTILRGSVKVFGMEYPFHQLVSEPEPGRVLVETDIETGQVTGWRFEPLADGAKTRVTIYSDFPPSPGIMGLMERLTKPAIVRDIYKKELGQLANYVRSKRAAAARIS